jgi:hypothetical protein
LIGGTILDRRIAIKARPGAARAQKSKSVQQVAGMFGRIACDLRGDWRGGRHR